MTNDELYRLKYLKYKNKYLQLKTLKQSQKGGADKPTLKLFKSENCGHCINFKPLWNELQDELKDKINFKTFDAVENNKEMQAYGIKGYPTLILERGNNKVEFNGDRNKENIINFINNYK
jgi:thiol-disulfide isomerase/thioredoxin